MTASLTISHQSAPALHTADPLPCIIIDGGVLGVDRTVTLCPHL